MGDVNRVGCKVCWHIELPTSGVIPPVPGLTRPDGTTPIAVTAVTVDGNAATVAGRFDSGASLGNEGDDQQNQYWVKARISPANGGPYTTAHVIFPDAPNGSAREFDSINTILVNPNP